MTERAVLAVIRHELPAAETTAAAIGRNAQRAGFLDVTVTNGDTAYVVTAAQTAAPKPTSTPSATMKAAALHVLLARHPELDQLPISWSTDPRDGIIAYVTHTVEPRLVRLIFTVLSGILQAETIVIARWSSTGRGTLMQSLTSELHGIPLFVTSHIPLHGPAPAPAAQ